MHFVILNAFINEKENSVCILSFQICIKYWITGFYIIYWTFNKSRNLRNRLLLQACIIKSTITNNKSDFLLLLKSQSRKIIRIILFCIFNAQLRINCFSVILTRQPATHCIILVKKKYI